MTELEKEVKDLKALRKYETTVASAEIEKLQAENTKAKEIIRDLLSCLYSVEYDRVSDLEEAEQFISEVEK